MCTCYVHSNDTTNIVHTDSAEYLSTTGHGIHAYQTFSVLLLPKTEELYHGQCYYFKIK